MDKKRRLPTILLAILSLGLTSSLLLATPRPAFASPTNDLLGAVFSVAGTVWKVVKEFVVPAAGTAVMNGLSSFMNRLAYQAAVGLTSDCPGQKPCWESMGLDMVKSAGEGAIGDFVGSLSDAKGMEKLGFNLCKPPSLDGSKFMMNVQLGMLDEAKPGKPKCDFNEMVSAYKDLARSLDLSDPKVREKYMGGISIGFTPGQAPLSMAISANLAMQTKKAEEAHKQEQKLLMEASAGGGFKAIEDPVTGEQKSPPAAAKKEFELQQEAQKKDPVAQNQQVTAAQISGEKILGVLSGAFATFAQTLASRALNKLATGLLGSLTGAQNQPDVLGTLQSSLTSDLSGEGDVGSQTSLGDAGSQVQARPAGQKGASKALADRFPSPAPREVGSIDPLLDFTVCDSSLPVRNPDNCVLDAEFAQAVRSSDLEPVTVREALAQGLIQDRSLYPSGSDKDRDVYCFQSGYCESNLKKLRAMRIIPIGWELAAHESKPEAPVKLSTVLAGYRDCNANGQADDKHPYCHLIDPDWVLKAPPVMCKAQVFGPQLTSPDIPNRAPVCVDRPSCLRQDDNGTCNSAYGYCLREKNVWRFSGQTCSEQYASCRTLTPKAGGATVSYLMNTVNRAACTADTVGCQAYSLNRHAATCQLSARCEVAGGCVCEAPSVGQCNVLYDSASCAIADGSVCTLSAACGNENNCPCDIKPTCLVPNGQISCTTLDGLVNSSADDWQVAPQRFLAASAGKCAGNADGCTTLFQLEVGQGLNLVRNGDFEEAEDGDGDGVTDHPRFWTPFGQSPTGLQGPSASVGTGPSALLVYSGQRAMLLKGAPAPGTGTTPDLDQVCGKTEGCPSKPGTGALAGYTCRVPKGAKNCPITDKVAQSGLPVRALQTMTLSMAWNGVLPQDIAGATAELEFFDSFGKKINLASDKITAKTSQDDLQAAAEMTCSLSGGILVLSVSAPQNKNVNADCSFMISDPAVKHARLVLKSAAGKTAMVDQVMLVEGGASEFHDGYGATPPKALTAKVPPAYLGCTGDSTDRPECAKYAGICRENEIGCQLYTPVNGDPAVPGILARQDTCPAECVGYDVFKQDASTFDNERFPVYFIPTTARSCSAAEVGCSQFTDVDSEAVAYYSQLRWCQAPTEAGSGTYYTWEGSETTGYELKVWSLKTTEGTVTTGDSTSVATDDFDVCADSSPGCANAGKAPCTKILTPRTASQFLCDDSSINSEVATGNPAKYILRCTKADVDGGDSDCREFYDKDGNRHYRRLSQTINVTADCRNLRITDITEPSCLANGGIWDVDDAFGCIFRADPPSSRSCPAAANGCRAYRGNASSNIKVVFTDNVETSPVGVWSGGTWSSESINLGGHSLKLASSGASATRGLFTTPPGGSQTSLLTGGRAYTLSFWARGTGSLNIRFDPSGTTAPPAFAGTEAQGRCAGAIDKACTVATAGSACGAGIQCVVPTVDLTSNWQQYTVGPIFVAEPVWSTATVLKITNPGTREAFIDNFVLRESQDTFAAVRDSWKTPASCDQTLDGQPSPLEMLGCRAYRDSAKKVVTVRSFSQLCRERSVGCSAYSKSEDTPAQPYEESFNAVCKLAVGRCSKTGTACSATQPCGASAGYCDYSCPSSASPACQCDYKVMNPATGTRGVVLGDVCRVPVGQAECRFHLDGWDDATSPADYPDRVNISADERAYLVVKDNNKCQAADVGCRAVGLPNRSFEKTCTMPTGGLCTAQAGCPCTDPVTNNACTIAVGQGSCAISLGTGIIDKWSGVALKDNPANYSRSLCTAAAVGCAEFSTDFGSVYMKDPGSQVCEYRSDAVKIDGALVSGWFRKSDSGAYFPCQQGMYREGVFYTIPKNGDASCTLPFICQDPRGCACPNETEPVCGVSPGNRGCGYQGWAGLCAAADNGCEEFVDPSASSGTNPGGTAYYYIMNARLDRTSCSGAVSIKQGCVLFNQTSNLQKTMASYATYRNEDMARNNERVAPVNCDLPVGQRPDVCDKRCVGVENGLCSTSRVACATDGDCGEGETCLGAKYYGSACTSALDCGSKTCSFSSRPCTDDNAVTVCSNPGERCLGPRCLGSTDLGSAIGNDSNIIIKVRRDRECGQWMECNKQTAVFDTTNNKWKIRCIGFGICSASAKFGESYRCTRWERPQAVPTQLLDSGRYSSRDIGWRGLDYSGYSIPNAYPVHKLQVYSFVDNRLITGVRNDTSSLTDGHGLCQNNLDCPGDRPLGNGLCWCSPGSKDADGDCIKNSQPTGICLYDLYGNEAGNISSPAAVRCRAYPEVDSPYGRTVLVRGRYGSNKGAAATAFDYLPEPWPAFKAANVCNPDRNGLTSWDAANACDCSYNRYEYGKGASSKLFRPISENNPPISVCSGGKNEGRPCPLTAGVADSVDCDKENGEMCILLNKKSSAIGWQGICVDYDQSVQINGSNPGGTAEYACLQYLPVDQVPGTPDIYNNFPDSGMLWDRDVIGKSGITASALLFCSAKATTPNIATTATEEKTHVQIHQEADNGGAPQDRTSLTADTWRLSGGDFGVDTGYRKYQQYSVSSDTYSDSKKAEIDLSGLGLKRSQVQKISFEFSAQANDCNKRNNPPYGVFTLKTSNLESGRYIGFNPYLKDNNHDEGPNLECVADSYGGGTPFSVDSESYGLGDTDPDHTKTCQGYAAEFKDKPLDYWVYDANDGNSTDWDGLDCWRFRHEHQRHADNESDEDKAAWSVAASMDGLMRARAIFSGDTLIKIQFGYCGSMHQNGTAGRCPEVMSNNNLAGLRTRTWFDALDTRNWRVNVFLDYTHVYSGSTRYDYCTEIVDAGRQVGQQPLVWTDKFRNHAQTTDIGSAHFLLSEDTCMAGRPNGELTTEEKLNFIMNPWGIANPVPLEADPLTLSVQAGPLAATTLMTDWSAATCKPNQLAAPATPFADDDYNRIENASSTKFSQAVAGLGFRNLKTMFLMLWGKYTRGASGYVKIADSQIDLRSLAVSEQITGGDTSIAPQIVAANTNACPRKLNPTATSEIVGACEEGVDDAAKKFVKNSLMVDGQTSGMIGNTLGGGLYTADITYFGYANKEHMPIVRHRFDPSDGSNPTDSDVMMLNHRGLTPGDCKSSPTTSLGVSCDKDTDCPGGAWCDFSLICTDDADGTWGLTPASCVTRYFKETVTYICNDEMFSDPNIPLCSTVAPNQGDQDNPSSKYPCIRDLPNVGKVCAFKPRIQITDNWGLCNGTCIGGTVPGYCIDDVYESYETCKLLGPSDVRNSAQRPWTDFAGEIIVKP